MGRQSLPCVAQAGLKLRQSSCLSRPVLRQARPSDSSWPPVLRGMGLVYDPLPGLTPRVRCVQVSAVLPVVRAMGWHRSGSALEAAGACVTWTGLMDVGARGLSPQATVILVLRVVCSHDRVTPAGAGTPTSQRVDGRAGALEEKQPGRQVTGGLVLRALLPSPSGHRVSCSGTDTAVDGGQEVTRRHGMARCEGPDSRGWGSRQAEDTPVTVRGGTSRGPAAHRTLAGGRRHSPGASGPEG